MNCPKCDKPLPEWMTDLYSVEELDYIARTHATEELCDYVACDSLDCRALIEPRTLEEYKTALEHFKSHRYLSGCSHGR